MSLDAWRAYLEVCRLGSLSAAAAELGYTQSAVSRQVAGLERLVGVPLLERRARGVVPTAAGEAFRHHARVVVNEAARAVRAARDAPAGRSAVAVGATPSTAAGIVPAALRDVQDGDPVTWTLITGLTPALEELVAAGELDLAVVTDAPPGLPEDPRVVRRPLGTDAMCVLVPVGHPVADAAGPVSITRFAEDVWVEDNDGSAALLRTACARAGFEPRIELRAADLPGKTAMVAAGHAVALVPGALTPALRRDVVAVPVEEGPTRGIFVTLPATPARAPEAVERLVQALDRSL